MTEDTRTIRVDYLARVEGEGALTLRFDGDDVQEVALRIFEPPRFFEAFLEGRAFGEAPDITARICGICPVAYQMSACAAMEDALGVALPPELWALRRALYCGEWIESHVLHIAMLHAPDFLGFDDAMSMAREHGDAVRASLEVKKAGNAIVRTLGGREIHPVNVRVGGFWRLPRRDELDTLLEQLREARALAESMVRWTATFDIPPLERPVTWVALQPDGAYPIESGAITSSEGLHIPPGEWDQHFEEEHVERSNALHARLHGAPYLCGPNARFNLAFDQLPDPLRALAKEIGAEPPVTNPFRSILVRGIETLYAFDEAIRILSSWSGAAAPAVGIEPRAGVGHGATEAPRGVLYHRYELDDDGLIRAACIVPPTSQNQLAIEADLRALAPSLRTLDDAAATWRAEQAIRNYDPCISCATHFLTLERVET